MSKTIKEIIIILIITTSLIFFRFNQIPKNLSLDEVEFTKLALSLDGKPYTPYSPYATGHSTLYFYLLLISFKIFGVTNLGLRFPSALFGTLNIIIFYLILKQVFGRRKQSINLPLILSLGLATSRWYFNFARFAFEATFLIFLELSSLYFLFKYKKTKKNLYSSLCMLFSGLAFNSYPPGRIFFLITLPSLIFLFLKKNGFSKKRLLAEVIIPLVIFVLTITPLSLYFTKHPPVRVNQQLFLKDKNLTLNKKLKFAWINIKKTALMFNFKGDVNGRHNYPYKPALNPILGLLLILGIFYSSIQKKDFSTSLFIGYFFISLLPSFLTYPWENPNMLRTITSLPSIFFFIGKGIQLVISQNLILKRKLFVSFLVLSLLAISSVYEIRTYFIYQSQVFKQAFTIKTTLDYLWKSGYIHLDHRKIKEMF